jgi:nitrogenase-associated protein
VDRRPLRGFFGARPVAEWFNRNAPRGKSGEGVPECMDEVTALSLMRCDPLLIRRPLIEADGCRQAGFDPQRIHTWIGLDSETSNSESASRVDLVTCPHQARGEKSTCP